MHRQFISHKTETTYLILQSKVETLEEVEFLVLFGGEGFDREEGESAEGDEA